METEFDRFDRITERLHRTPGRSLKEAVGSEGRQALVDQKRDLALLKQGGNEDGTFTEIGMAIIRERMFARSAKFLLCCSHAQLHTARRLAAYAIQGATL